MKSRVATITAVSALSLADPALRWALLALAAGVILITLVLIRVVVARAVDSPKAARKVLRILLEMLRICLGRPRG